MGPRGLECPMCARSATRRTSKHDGLVLRWAPSARTAERHRGTRPQRPASGSVDRWTRVAEQSSNVLRTSSLGQYRLSKTDQPTSCRRLPRMCCSETTLGCLTGACTFRARTRAAQPDNLVPGGTVFSSNTDEKAPSGPAGSARPSPTISPRPFITSSLTRSGRSWSVVPRSGATPRCGCGETGRLAG